MTWTDEAINELETMWVAGDSSAQIATRLNQMTGKSFTRNAVVGKARRLGLPPHIWGNKPRSAKSQRKKSAPRLSRTNNPRPPRFVPEPIPAPEIGIDGGIDLIDIVSGQCRFPFGDAREGTFKFCGHPIQDGSSYCAGHHQICYQPANRAELARREAERAKRKAYLSPIRAYG